MAQFTLIIKVFLGVFILKVVLKLKSQKHNMMLNDRKRLELWSITRRTNTREHMETLRHKHTKKEEYLNQ